MDPGTHGPDIIRYITSLETRHQWIGVVVVGVAYLLVSGLIARNKRFVDVPVSGYSGLLSSYITGFDSYFRGYMYVAEGYKNYKGGTFKTAEVSRWHVWVSGPVMDQIRKAPDDLLRPMATKELLQADILVNPAVESHPYQVGYVTEVLTKQLVQLFPTMVDEMRIAFATHIPQWEDWTSIKMMDVIPRIVCQTTNRIIVGDKVCRDEEWNTINVNYTGDVFIGAMLVSLFPRGLQRFVGRWIIRTPHLHLKSAVKIIGPAIQQRIKMIDELGSDSELLPDDVITWLLKHTAGAPRTPSEITSRILFLNIGAIHTTAMAISLVIYHLCAFPEYVRELRAEVEEAIDNDGWTKHAMFKCRKVDSFIKETLRMYPGIVATTDRLALKSFTLVDGTYIPKGTRISGVAAPMMTDPDRWGQEADKFDGFRFSKKRSDGSESSQHLIVQTSLDFLTFGHGKHACPGRFFAANELKALTSYVLLNYDVKFKDEKLGHGKLPTMTWFGTGGFPNQNEEVLFRRRHA